ncbi:MAG: putative toxin-antitoxin system toxin component, PIN family, partial [bacterium]
ELNMPKKLVTSFLTSLNESGTVSHVNLGKRLIDSRDPKDNPFLSTAATGRAKYLITNDNDLLEIPEVKKRRYKFKILTPAQFLRAFS